MGWALGPEELTAGYTIFHKMSDVRKTPALFTFSVHPDNICYRHSSCACR
jgi:hypothetical protein